MQVAKLRNSVKEALIVQQDCEAHKEALNAVGQMLLTSSPDLEATDFKQLLSVKRQLILDDLGCAAHYLSCCILVIKAHVCMQCALLPASTTCGQESYLLFFVQRL